MMQAKTDIKAIDFQFMEIEHKFLEKIDFDPQQLFSKLRSLRPDKEYSTLVSDTYFLVEKLPGHVFRHRCDNFIQQLTLKSMAGDSESRVEVNLDLGLSSGDQSLAARAFIEPLKILWSGTLKKLVHVYYFPEVEIVFYTATFDGNTQNCVEVEVRNPKSYQSAKQTLNHWEALLGYDPAKRCHKSILELLVLPTLGEDVLKHLKYMV